MKNDNLREPSFYRKYSPHHEFPLSVVVALSVHVAVAIFLVVWVLFPSVSADEPYAPPKMDTVFLEDGAGFQGLSGTKGPKGGDRAKKEMRKRITDPKKVDKIALKKEIPDVPEIKIDVPTIDPVAEPEQADEFAEIAKQADDLFRKQAGLPPRSDGGGGDGGQGNKKGPMKAKDKGFGRQPTKQQIYAGRWDFDFSQSPAENLRKVDKINAILLVLPPQQKIWFTVTDLNRRPAELKIRNLSKLQKAVMWYVQIPSLLQNMARELRLPFVPRSMAFVLPKEHADRFLVAELAYAKKYDRTEGEIHKTLFDVRLEGGQFIPAVREQLYVDGQKR